MNNLNHPLIYLKFSLIKNFYFYIFLFCLITPQKLIRLESDFKFVIWNIGQGQWITYSTPDTCLHFDFGGENSQFKKIQKSLLRECQKKRNGLILSHLDRDHVSFLPSILKNFQKVCLIKTPLTQLSLRAENLKTQKISKKKLQTLSTLSKILHCQFKTSLVLINSQEQSDRNVPINSQKVLTSKLNLSTNDSSVLKGLDNESSLVFYYKQFLIPGDSPQQQERLWSQNLNFKNKTQYVKYLLLGHHGSRTSTSSYLIKNLPNLTVAFVQARKKRYGHPHIDVRQRLAQFKIPLIEIETTNSIYIPLKPQRSL